MNSFSPDLEAPIICDQFRLCCFTLSFVTSSKLIIFASLYYVATFNILFLTYLLVVPYAYVSIKSIHYIILSSFELKAILLISSVKLVCLSHLSCSGKNGKSFWRSCNFSKTASKTLRAIFQLFSSNFSQSSFSWKIYSLQVIFIFRRFSFCCSL